MEDLEQSEKPCCGCVARRPLATVPQLAVHYSVPVATIRRWHHTQTVIGPLMFRAGKYLRARWEDIDAYDAYQIGGES